VGNRKDKKYHLKLHCGTTKRKVQGVGDNCKIPKKTAKTLAQSGEKDEKTALGGEIRDTTTKRSIGRKREEELPKKKKEKVVIQLGEKSGTIQKDAYCNGGKKKRWGKGQRGVIR